ncbi:glutamine-hydrolyzing GMP synthase [Candidatus Persebacteraceae bacterium Df01]|jgi:GMP synthase (glutamine-hydrolysing)|uniref:GMP synthase [glutamine-hydrolyzing] n=1 Tax=Candidatus Doriopsillibacter californiensis TaxID=2970740 RepID=A0ABT7QLU5_9GAMM|nr:glutamine-hydrolyzing GMP synthase [Candidatus Persebacteraceae bacterium Df01]
MQKILILDYGSQYTQLIARKIRELQAYCEIHPHDWLAENINAFAPSGIILSGGPNSAMAAGAPAIQPAVFSAGVPVLGLCYGMQVMALALGGEVEVATHHEYGQATVHADHTASLFAGLPQEPLPVLMSHGDRVLRPPAGFTIIAKSDSSPVAAMADETRRLYGLQFHPETAHTLHGREILERFVRGICQVKATWTMSNFVTRETEVIRRRVGDEGVLLGLSGGVDSAVVAALLHHAIGEQLHCVLVDHGLMRAGEADEVKTVFEDHFGVNLTIINAADKFFSALRGVEDPEEKRRHIGRLFVEEFEAQARKFSDTVRWLAQGTIYPDVVESAGDGAGKAVIKSHHNVGGLPERLNLKLLEPLRNLFKDEVRQLGLTLSLPERLVQRHPFPGPGLAVRVLGEVTPERAEIARQADAVYMEELETTTLYATVSQAFAVLLPVRSVGVMGDDRTYDNVVALRAVTTDDFMTADWARLPDDFLARVSSRIINTVAGVNRVVYDISSKPPATVEWE